MKALNHLFLTFFLAMVLFSCQKEDLELLPASVDKEVASTDTHSLKVHLNHETIRLDDAAPESAEGPDLLIQGKGFVEITATEEAYLEVGSFKAVLNDKHPCSVFYSIRSKFDGIEGQARIKTSNGDIFLRDIAKYGDRINSVVVGGTGVFEGVDGKMERQIQFAKEFDSVDTHNTYASLYMSGWMTK